MSVNRPFILRNVARLLFFVALLAFPVHAAKVWLRQWDEPFFLSGWGAAAIAGFVAACIGMIVAKMRHQAVLLPPLHLLLLTLLSAAYGSCCNVLAYAAPWQFHLPLLLTMGMICLLWSVLRHHAIVLWGPFLMLGAIQFAAFHQYGSRLNSLVIAETMEASFEESLAYMTPLNLSLLGLGIVVIVIFCWLQYKLLHKRHRLELLNTGLLFCGLCGIFGSTLRPAGQTPHYYWPACEVPEFQRAFTEAFTINEQTINQVESLTSPVKETSAISTLKGGEGVVLVLHVGESIRADRMGINGYLRDTTPFLSRCGENLINFPTCISAASDTCQAQIVIMTDARRGVMTQDVQMLPSTGSVLDLFALHRFDVYSFFGRRCAQQLKFDRVVRVLTKCSTDRFNAPGYPWTSVEQMKEVLHGNDNKNLVFFINNEGSHTPFCYYDELNPPFTPTTPNFQNPSAQAEEVNNAYDNTIHYTDEFFRRIAEMLQGRPFVYLYVSDHGEYLGHDGMWGRAPLGNNPALYHSTTGCKVGMFVLYSPEFAALHPHFAKALQQMKSNSKLTVAHEHVFHSLLGLFGISTPYYDARLDLTSQQVEPYNGPQPVENFDSQEQPAPQPVDAE